MDDLRLLWIFLAALAGNTLMALLGWCDSKDPWNTKKFLRSFIVGFFTSAGLAGGYTFMSDKISFTELLMALSMGMGIEAGADRVMGTFGWLRVSSSNSPPKEG